MLASSLSSHFRYPQDGKTSDVVRVCVKPASEKEINNSLRSLDCSAWLLLDHLMFCYNLREVLGDKECFLVFFLQYCYLRVFTDLLSYKTGLYPCG